MFGDKHNRTLLKGNKTINMNFKYTILTDRSKYNLINHLLIIARLHVSIWNATIHLYQIYKSTDPSIRFQLAFFINTLLRTAHIKKITPHWQQNLHKYTVDMNNYQQTKRYEPKQGPSYLNLKKKH